MSIVSLKETESRMRKAVDNVVHEFVTLRSGRASANMLDAVQVEAYGAVVPLPQIAGVSVLDARLLSVTVWDENLTKAVEKAILDSRLGLMPQTEGNVLRLPVPSPSEERRRELAKLASKYAEGARIAIRNIRRDAMDSFKRAEKAHDIGQDEMHKLSSQTQSLTDEYVAKIDTLLGEKEKEITSI